MALQALPPQPVYRVVIKRHKKSDCIKVATIPPEEFIIARDATDEDSAPCIGQRRTEMRVSDLVAMGYDIDDVLSAADDDSDNSEKELRNPGIRQGDDDSLDPSMRKVKYCEVLIRVDTDGDGIAELVKFCTIGDSHIILHAEPWQEVNYAIFSPAPEPHTAIGKGIADETMDLQRIKTQLMRFTLDGLAQAITPRTGYDYTTVNSDDMASAEVGANVRVKGPPANSIMPIAAAFPADQALGMLTYLDEVKASRTGVSKASQGLDMDVLQGTTATAVTATVNAAEMRQELIARFFAETLKRVFRGILKLVHRHQDRPRMIRLRNKFIEVDPSSWNTDMDVTVNVAIGTANRNERVVALGQVATKQEQILQTLGPDNPLCDISHLRNTYAKMLELVGEKDVGKYFKEITPEQVRAAAQQQGQGGDAQKAQADAATQIAKAETIKAQADMISATQKPKLERDKAIAENDFKRDQLESEIIVKATELALKYGVNVADMVELVFGAMARAREQQPMPDVPPGLNNVPMGVAPGQPGGGPPAMAGNGAMPPGMQ